MGRIPSGNRKTQLRSVQPQHREVLRRIAAGHKSKDIAESLGVTPVTVSTIKNSEVSKPVLEDLSNRRDDNVLKVKDTLSDLGLKAADVLKEVLEDPDTSVSNRIRVSMDILDRVGAKAPTKIEAVVEDRIVDADMLREIKKRSVEAAEECGLIVNVPVKDVSDSVSESTG